MTNGNQTYTAIAQFINALDVDRHEIAHAITLLAAQMPNASVSLVEVFLFAEGIQTADHGTKLLRVRGLRDPEEALGASGIFMQNDKVSMENQELPNDEWDRPLVKMEEHPTLANVCILDRHNTEVLCKFHSQLPPRQQEFEEKKTEELIIRVAYGHVQGGFNIRCQKHPPGSSLVEMHGEFTVSAFIPVRAEVITTGDATD